MPQPTTRLGDDALVAEILARVPEAGAERRVRSLLAAWWRYAGVRNAAGAVVDSETFVAERGALGLLELPPAVAKRVIELEFALLHQPATGAAQPVTPPPAPAPTPEPPAEQAPALRVVPPSASASTPAPEVSRAAEPAPSVEAPPARRERATPPRSPQHPRLARRVKSQPTDQAAPDPARTARIAPPPAPPAPEAPAESFDVELSPQSEPEPITAFEAFQDVRERTREEAQTAIMAGILVFFSVVVGLALVLGQQVDHLSLPTGGDEALVAGWRSFLAICSGFGGCAVGVVAASRLGSRRGAVLAPTVGLLGLGVLGLGLLSGSAIITGIGGVVFVLGAAVALLRR